MPSRINPLLLRALALLAAAAPVAGRPLLARLAVGRTVELRVRTVGPAALRAHGLHVRLFGIEPPGSLRTLAGETAALALDALIGEAPVRLRGLAVDRRGRLVAVLRNGRGEDVAAALLRAGHAQVRGTKSRRYRAWQAQAMRARRGLWADTLGGRPPPPAPGIRPVPPVCPWWQG